MNSIKCPYCDSAEHHLTDEHCYQCDSCYWHFTTDAAGNVKGLDPDLQIDSKNLGKS